jgi:hypothetical protein
MTWEPRWSAVLAFPVPGEVPNGYQAMPRQSTPKPVRAKPRRTPASRQVSKTLTGGGARPRPAGGCAGDDADQGADRPLEAPREPRASCSQPRQPEVRNACHLRGRALTLRKEGLVVSNRTAPSNVVSDRRAVMPTLYAATTDNRLMARDTELGAPWEEVTSAHNITAMTADPRGTLALVSKQQFRRPGEVSTACRPRRKCAAA